jgi:hypothetical protein
LLLLEPCGVFHPLTPLRFASPSPRFIAFPGGPEDLHGQTRGAGWVTEGSRMARGAGSPKLPLAVSPPLRLPKQTVRLRLPSCVRLSNHPPPTGLRRRSSGGFSDSGCPYSVTVMASQHGPVRQTPLQGVPLPRLYDPPAAFYRCRWPLPPGTDPCGPACAHDRFPSRGPDRSRLPTFPPRSPLHSPKGISVGSPQVSAPRTR